MRPRLLIVATHPIQYHSPWFRDLAKREDIEIEVAFCELPDASRQGVGFGVEFTWDLPLTDGFPWRKLEATLAHENQGFGFWGRRLRNARAQLAEMRPDAVLVLGWNQFALLQAWAAARTLGLPVIVRGESNAKRPRVWWKRLLHRALLSQAQCFVSIGKSNEQFYREAGVPDARLKSGAYFVDNLFFSARAELEDRETVRSRFKVPPSSMCVLFAGKFETKKRPLDLIDAIKRLPDSIKKKVHLVFVGAGELEPGMRAACESGGVACTWAGFLNQTEIPAAYRAADVLVLPSDHGETWGLVVNEAMACGVPCIVGDQVGCANDLVLDNVTGWVFPTGDIGAFAKAIVDATDVDRRTRLGAAAKARVHNEYTIQKSTEALVAAVACVLAGRHGRVARE